MSRINVNITNSNELTKTEFDKQREENNWDVYSKAQVGEFALKAGELIAKSQKEELSPEEGEILKSIQTELKHTKKIVINENKSGRICKGIVYVQEPQVEWVESIEKSIDGKPYAKGTFLDTPLNRELDRVGEVIEKGKKAKDDKDMAMEYMKAMESDMYKALCKMKTDGMKDEDIDKAMKDKYEDMEDDKYNSMKKAYAYNNMKKAIEVEIEEKDDDKGEGEDEKEDDAEKGKK